MLSSVSLRVRLFAIFGTMSLLMFICSIAMLWHATEINNLIKRMVQKELVIYKISQKLEVSLANQKGLLTFFFVDGNQEWLDSLETFQTDFERELNQVLNMNLSSWQRQILQEISENYIVYKTETLHAVEEYLENPATVNISEAHARQRDHHFNLLYLCAKLGTEQWDDIIEEEIREIERSEVFKQAGYLAIISFTILCPLFFFLLYKKILGPIRDMALQTGSTFQASSQNEIASLEQSLGNMKKGYDQANDELTRSRKNLVEAEKMAMVGELAAGVAHTIRNPFTSIKMRMFTLSRSSQLSNDQTEDLKVISEEIDRIDNVVTSFLEFSRPPKIKLEKHDLKEVIQSVGKLMEFKLQGKNAELTYDFQPDLPEVLIDYDRMREALLGLLTNSCEAFVGSGRIVIRTASGYDPNDGNVVEITVRDDGPGIPETIRDKVTSPFFTTKDEGSGLGLSIVDRIAREHGGKLSILPTNTGTKIRIRLPM